MENMINLDDSNVHYAVASVAQIREFFDGRDLPEDVELKFDEAQGQVFSKEHRVAYIVIEVQQS